MVITYFMLQTRIKRSQCVAGAVYGCFSSQDIPVGDPFHQVHMEVDSIGTCAWNKPGKVKMEALQGHRSTGTSPHWKVTSPFCICPVSVYSWTEGTSWMHILDAQDVLLLLTPDVLHLLLQKWHSQSVGGRGE